MADAEPEETFPELLAPLCLTDVDPAATQHVLETRHERGQLQVPNLLRRPDG